MAKIDIDWYTDKVLLAAEEALNLEAVALRIEERAKINVVGNNQVDTGFMLNSIYTVTEKSNNYSAARAAAGSRNPGANMAPRVSLERGAWAAVAAGAEYSIYQEIKKSFLLAAAQETAAEVGGVVKTL
jgi:hypothetical protein